MDFYRKKLPSHFELNIISYNREKDHFIESRAKYIDSILDKETKKEQPQAAATTLSFSIWNN
jgi:ppGpp synthetase/RelA/SpoT-type nucleotidyltranferase